ncbi:MAG: radical SAM protein [Planctomycetota bacterium]|nr:radical SAM protein [Planctomycetota bacterium]
MEILNKARRIINNPGRYFTPEYLASYYRSTRTSLMHHLPSGGFSCPPRWIAIVPTAQCNARCKMCDIGQKMEGSAWVRQLKGPSGREPLSIEEWKSFIDDIRGFKPRLAFTGGEPLVYPHILEMFEHINYRKLKFSNTTNGILLEKHAEDMVRLGMSCLGVSVTGPPKIHDFIAGVAGAFEKIVNGIEAIKEAKAKYLKKDAPRVRINCPVFELNYMHLKEFASVVKDMPEVSMVTFTHQYVKTKRMVDGHNHLSGDSFPITASTNAVNPQNVDTERLIRELDAAKAVLSEKQVIVRPELSPSEIRIWYGNPHMFVKGHDKCKGAYSSAVISANGDVVGPSSLCTNYVFGNIRDDTLLDIWNNEKYRKFRVLIEKKLFPICSRCCRVC